VNNINVVGGLFPALAMLVGVAYAVFWMVVGWRAMRAHERLAEATAELARKG
jgi:uncharacterized membrane protein